MMKSKFSSSQTKVFRLLTILCVAATAFSQAPAKPIRDLQPTVLLISIDGFRADYLQRFQAPTLHMLAAAGASGSMFPSFPSLTFPNHYAIATGLYPSENGIVGNRMRDPHFQATFEMSNAAEVQNGRWWGGEPIWVTAEKQHDRAGIMFWPGSEAKIEGVRPSLFKHFNKSLPPDKRAQQVLDWFDLPRESRPTFFALYFDDVDTAGHHFGPDSQQLEQAIIRVDSAIGLLYQGLKARGVADKVNIIIISDHGMASTSRDRIVILDNYLDVNKLDVVDWEPAFQFGLKDPADHDTMTKLGKAPHMTIYRRDLTPLRWHYRNNARITPWIGILDEGWLVSSKKRFESDPTLGVGGAHGYDINLRSMRAIFIAKGPGFRVGSHLNPFQNINLYSLLAKLLALDPAKTEGDVSIFAPVLRSPKRHVKSAAD